MPCDYEPAGRAGSNYGWRFRAGAHPYSGSTTSPLVDPLCDYDHVGPLDHGAYAE
jgi:hypothetical protein